MPVDSSPDSPDSFDSPDSIDTLASDVVAILTARRHTIAVAESLTGGLLASALTGPPGASAVTLGAVVAYATEVKSTVLGVDPTLLREHGAVHPEVAAQMARSVRTVLAVGGTPADIGVSTTGVAGPGPSGGHPAGTVFLGFSIGSESHVVQLALSGRRDDIRSAVVYESLSTLKWLLG